MRALIAITLITLPALASAQSVYRCEINGRAVFQDRPCAAAVSERIKVRVPGAAPATPVPVDPMAGFDPELIPAQGASTQDRTAALQRYNDQVATDRRLRELSRRAGRLEAEREGLQQQMERELGRLKTEQGLAANNLAGATYLQSINTEMQAVTSSYGVRISNKDREIADVRAEMAALDN